MINSYWNRGNLIFFKENILNACLESFGNRAQYIELIFSSSKYDEIRLSLQCNIFKNDSKVDYIVNQLKSYSKDIYKLAYFIPLNLKQVKSCIISNNSIILEFENLIAIEFKFDQNDFEIGVSFKESHFDTQFITIFLSTLDFPGMVDNDNS